MQCAKVIPTSIAISIVIFSNCSGSRSEFSPNNATKLALVGFANIWTVAEWPRIPKYCTPCHHGQKWGWSLPLRRGLRFYATLTPFALTSGLGNQRTGSKTPLLKNLKQNGRIPLSPFPSPIPRPSTLLEPDGNGIQQIKQYFVGRRTEEDVNEQLIANNQSLRRIFNSVLTNASGLLHDIYTGAIVLRRRKGTIFVMFAILEDSWFSMVLRTLLDCGTQDLLMMFSAMPCFITSCHGYTVTKLTWQETISI